MTVSTRKSSVEPYLWPDVDDKPIVRPAEVRNLCGDFFEEATANLSGGWRCKTDCTKDICPDVQIGPKQYLESKSVGQNANAIVYEQRLHKDLNFYESRTGFSLNYVFWHHTCRAQLAPTRHVLRSLLAHNLQCVVVVSVGDLYQFCQGRPTKVLNAHRRCLDGQRSGYGSSNYTTGWSIPIRDLKLVALRESQLPRVEACGVAIDPVPLFGHWV